LVVLVDEDVDAVFEDVRLRDTYRWDGVAVLLQRGEFVFGLGD
jgi:chorismate mutase